MYVKQTFALIKDETVVNDIVCDNYELANQLARKIYGENAIAIESTQYPISVGDNYRDGVFYYKHSENAIPRQNTGEENALLAVEKVNDLEAEIASDNVDLDYRLSNIELGLEG